MPSGDIITYVYFPTSISKDVEAVATTNDSDVIQFEGDAENLLQKLLNDVPLVVCFHGGSLNIGTGGDNTALELVTTATELKGKPIILAMVDYSLVPEFTFPVAPVEAMTVILHFLERMPKRNIHIWGTSAGCLLSVDEVTRLFPGRISTPAMSCPMLDPMADSSSYYLHGSGTYVDPAWVRWCWQAFLGLPRTKDTAFPRENPSLDDFCKFQSNRTTFNESRWKGH